MVALFFIGVFSSLFYLSNSVSNNYLINAGDTLKIDSIVPVRASYCVEDKVKVEYQAAKGDTFKMDLKLLGIIPAKRINVKVVDENYVAVLGTPFGIKIYTEGVLVVGFSDIDTDDENKNPL